MGLLGFVFRNTNSVKYLRTSTAPCGPLLHFGEYDGKRDIRTTTGHPAYFDLRRNEQGTYDVERHVREGFAQWSTTRYFHGVPQPRAVNALIGLEMEMMRKFGGHNEGLSEKTLRDHILSKKFESAHIFRHLQKNPAEIDRFLAEAYPGLLKVSKQDPAAPK